MWQAWAFLVAAVLIAPSGAERYTPPVGRACNGSYHGVYNQRYGVESFLGVPFAQPPVADLRLRPPQSLNSSWHGARNAIEYGDACVGYGDDTELVADGHVSEDCLTLNIIRPAGTAASTSLPVLVWVYGGGFFSGASRDQRYNLTFIVEHSVRMGKPVMAVSMNYRLAGYGFLYSDEIAKAGLANLGLRDQRMALHWIQENIAGFGGNPDKVTIWGESAGGVSVGHQLRAFNGRDDKLFHRAMANSGAVIGIGVGGLGAATSEDIVKKVYNNVTRTVGCDASTDQLQCLRAVPADQFKDAIGASLTIPSGGRMAYQPLVDGDFVAASGVKQLKEGAFVKVPFAVGDNTDEGTTFSPFGINTEAELRSFLGEYEFTEHDISALLELYPAGSTDLILHDLEPWNETIGAQWSRVSSIVGDLMFITPRYFSTRAWVNASDAPLYNFRFDATPNGVPQVWSATHFMESPFFFHNTEGTGFPDKSVPFLGPNPFDNLPQAAFTLADTILVRKIDYRLLPITATIYLLCYLDRSNIGNARILNSDTGDDIMQTLSLTSHQYTIALMLFLVAYSLFEAPSNLSLKILSPKRWLGFLVFAFGAFCMGIGGAQNFATVSALRFFLGAAEAGVFPGMIYYLSFWYKPEERAFRIAAFLCSATLAGACIAYGVGFMNRAGGLQAWRWLFLLEGAPSGKKSCQKITWVDARATLLDLRLYAHYSAYIGIGCLIGSLSLFAPTIVLGLGFEGLRAQLFTVPPYAAAFLSTIAASVLSDRFNTPALPGEHFVGRYILLIIGTCGAFSGLPSVNAWIGDNMTNTTAMSLATAINIAFSGPGQIIGVWIYRPVDRPLYTLGHGVNAGFAALSALLCFGLTFYYRRLNSNGKLRPDGRPWVC
ncbi:hypothetical protein LCI18_000447 [Fusarium solani-melongenae]|uniref:Uncharacterized protein n=1 Tax=Fusarium solani subsp. cucurbitae TaxID=2747967 RepID=A0ACD3YKQ5_FUSSC|nr:hypothetical protein LCI18_000447 [Fusarium solani-melongenae]